MYKQLVVLHSNVELSFSAYLRHVAAGAVLSLLDKAKQNPNYIQFLQDDELDIWLSESCPHELVATSQNAIRAIYEASRKLDLPNEILYASISNGNRKVESVLVIGPCDAEIVDNFITTYKLQRVISSLEFFDPDE
jgi:hypothetical protein